MYPNILMWENSENNHSIMWIYSDSYYTIIYVNDPK